MLEPVPLVDLQARSQAYQIAAAPESSRQVVYHHALLLSLDAFARPFLPVVLIAMQASWLRAVAPPSFSCSFYEPHQIFDAKQQRADQP